ncbi:MAG: FAD:protein FMN transferase [Candidatus Neomarinimicrobiota bacterium]|nr:FAD:protein FMN transferase [Candidatus Neomarinimicrobiota bacterium]
MVENSFSSQTMGTTYSIKIISQNLIPNLSKIQKGIDSVLTVVNMHMSIWIPTSEISRFNRNQSRNVIPVSHHFKYVIKKSIEISEATGGAFDVTVYDLMALWGFGPDPQKREPLEKDIQHAMENLGYHNLVLEPEGIRKKNPRTKVDLNSIAKGYGVDQVFHWLVSRGFADVFVEIGGEVRCSGMNKNRLPWRVGIDHPSIEGFPGSELAGVVSLDNQALATSGNYQNFIEWNGKFFGHTIDPRIGRPVQKDVLSVSVISNSCMEADGWATALMVLGYDKGRELALQKTGLQVCWILSESDGMRKIEKTPGFNIQNFRY